MKVLCEMSFRQNRRCDIPRLSQWEAQPDIIYVNNVILMKWSRRWQLLSRSLICPPGEERIPKETDGVHEKDPMSRRNHRKCHKLNERPNHPVCAQYSPVVATEEFAIFSRSFPAENRKKGQVGNEGKRGEESLGVCVNVCVSMCERVYVHVRVS